MCLRFCTCVMCVGRILLSGTPVQNDLQVFGIPLALYDVHYDGCMYAFSEIAARAQPGCRRALGLQLREELGVHIHPPGSSGPMDDLPCLEKHLLLLEMAALPAPNAQNEVTLCTHPTLTYLFKTTCRNFLP